MCLLNFTKHVFLSRISKHRNCYSKAQVKVVSTCGSLMCLALALLLLFLVNVCLSINDTLGWAILHFMSFVVSSPLTNFQSNPIKQPPFVLHVNRASCTSFTFLLLYLFLKVPWTSFFLMFGAMPLFFLAIIKDIFYASWMILVDIHGFFLSIANLMLFQHSLGSNFW
jgi:hypothetical protein